MTIKLSDEEMQDVIELGFREWLQSIASTRCPLYAGFYVNEDCHLLELLCSSPPEEVEGK